MLDDYVVCTRCGSLSREGKPPWYHGLLTVLLLLLFVIPGLVYLLWSKNKVCPECGGSVVPRSTPVGQQLAPDDSEAVVQAVEDAKNRSLGGLVILGILVVILVVGYVINYMDGVYR